MPRIRSLRPNVTREDAIDQFSRGPLATVRRVALGPLQSVADFYIPFRLFQVEITNAGRSEMRILGLDVISGSLDLYTFDQIPDASEVVTIDTRNCPEVGLDDFAAGALIVERVRRILFSRGFFRMRNPTIRALPTSQDLYVPYWVGFYGSGNQARLSVIDAVRRRFEGAKVRHLLQSWLTAPACSGN